MTTEKIIFYVFSAILVFAAFKVITARNPVHSAMFLVLAFFTTSAHWIMLEAEFLAITLVLVYVGAVMVLFLFVVMMLDINLAPLREGFIKHLSVGIGVGLVIVVEMAIVLSGNFGVDKVSVPERHSAEYSNIEAIGNVLYSEYLFAFEVAAVILLVAIIAAISLTMRKKPGTKHQNPGEQVMVRKEDRLRIVKMKSEKRIRP